MAPTDVGIIGNTPKSFSGTVNNEDRRDIYRFTLDGTSNFNLALTGLSKNADVVLARDANGDGFINPGEEITGSFRGGKSDESINRASLPAGDYLAEVQQVSGNTQYNLKLSTSNPSNLLPTEVNVGTLNGTQTFNDFVGSNDTADVYQFRLTERSNFSLSLTGLSADADVRLIRDRDPKGVINLPNDVITGSSAGSNSNESIFADLGAGNYFVQVYQFSGDTNYTLSLTA